MGLGVMEGEYISIPGAGNRLSGQKGDLMVQFVIRKSDVFSRKKNDIYTTVTVGLYDALMGGDVLVPTINGNVQMKITPGSQPDDVRKLSGRGIYNATTGEQGNQYVKLKVELPRSLSAEQKDLLTRCFNPNKRDYHTDEKKQKPFETSTNNDNQSESPKAQTDSWLDKLWRWFK